MALAGAHVSRASRYFNPTEQAERLYAARQTRLRRRLRRWHLRRSPPRPTALVVTLVVLALLALSPFARADCRCSVDAPPCPPGALVTCDVETFNAAVDALLVAEHDRDVARAANKRLEEELRVRITPVEGAVWPWAAGGVLVGIVLGVVLVR